MSETIQNVQAETIQAYCQQLGLQEVRENDDNHNGACSTTFIEQPREEIAAVSSATPESMSSKIASHPCTNCGKSFSSSRQYLKHKCSTNEETSPKKPVRGRKKKPLKKYLAAKAEKKGMEPTTAQVDEDTTVVVHMKDHTYNRDDDISNSATKDKAPLNISDKCSVILCDVCKMFPDSVSATKSNPSGQCEKCRELSQGLETGDEPEMENMVDEKRKYKFKNPEEFCPHCKKGFHSEKRLAKHKKICGKDLVCEFCGEDFNGVGQNAYNKYEEHYYTHVEEKPFHCNVCNKGFVRKPDLDKHNVIHTAHESHMCAECGAVFATAKLLNKHKKKHERPKWDCPKCKRQFLRQVVYEKHILTCQVQVSCEVCGKIFTCLSKNVKYRYQEHMFIHTGEKPYKCQYCERAFRDRSTRKKHERTHTGEKPYPCTICDRAFSQLRLLRNHVRTHTGEKPFACELCDLRFAKQCNLKYHIRVHTKEKPYTCQLCQKSFSQSGTYHKHMRRHGESNRKSDGNVAKDASMEDHSISNRQSEGCIGTVPQLATESLLSQVSMATESESYSVPTESDISAQTAKPGISIATDPEDCITTESTIYSLPTESEVCVATESQNCIAAESEISVATGPDASMGTDPTVVPIAAETEVSVIPTDNPEAEHVVQHIPGIGNDEITIIVSEGNVDGETLRTIAVEQISKMFVS